MKNYRVSIGMCLAMLLAFSVNAQTKVSPPSKDVVKLKVATKNSSIQAVSLVCEMLKNPFGIDVLQPRLSWRLESNIRNTLQNAYQILVASSKEKLAKNEGDLWNAGKVNAENSTHIKYEGSPLLSNQTCYWKIKSFTSQGVSDWSEPATFTMGLLSKNDWKAKWIGMDSAFAWDSVTQFSRLSARYLRKQFVSDKVVKKAVIYVSGLGLYELYINGKKMGNQVLAPAPTDYRKTVLYNSYDVSSELKKGMNAIGTVLGNGRFFTMRQDYKPKKINTFGYPKLLLQLDIDYTDGSSKRIVSDETWKLTTDGPIRSNNEYDGEEYDANKELTGWNSTGFNDSKWMQVQMVEAPDGKLSAQMQESMKVMQIVKPIKLVKQQKGYILDMGQNMVGWLQMKVTGKKGKQVQLRFAESLQKDGSLYTANLRDAKVTDIYTLKGTGVETWHPTFVFHGFRYIEIVGYPSVPDIKNFEGQMVYDNLANTGTFESSNATLNKIHQNAWWGIAGNYKGMPIDCPQRNERQPWLGDRAMGALGESFLFGNGNLYAKWLNDIEDAQTAEGVIPDVAPAFWNYYTDDITWPATYITVADMLYNQYGDKSSIEKHYASMMKWATHIQTAYLKEGLITKDKYGDWCVPPESLELIHAKDSTRITNGGLIATAYYYKLMQYLQKFAILMNQPDDAKRLAHLNAQIKTAFNNKYFNKAKKLYDNNTVTANLLPLTFGLVQDSMQLLVFNQIVTKILVENHGHISTGLIGSQFLMRGLSENDRPDIAYQIASSKTYPGWGYMVESGATTIWELWNGNTANPQMNSQNHVMLLGDLLTWMYQNLGGIKSDDVAVGFKNIIMKPSMIDGLNSVNVTYSSIHGLIKSKWKNSVEKFEWSISVPANNTAFVYIPASYADQLFESGKLIEKNNSDSKNNAASKHVSNTQNAAIKLVGYDQTNMIVEIGSGDYAFVVKKAFKKAVEKSEFIFEEASFPESHASTIVETPKGIVASWFGGTKEGNKDVCIWVSHLNNNKWSSPVKVADGIVNDTLRYPCYNPVLYQVPGGELLLFYKIGPNVAGWTGWMKRSTDNGHTWSTREALPDGFLGPIKNKPELINGVLVCPSSTEKNGWKVHFEYTKDNGKTWTKSANINDGITVSAIQPSLLKYNNGWLQVLCRSRNRTVNESWSKDGGKTWLPMQATNLPNNNSGTDAVTLNDGRQLLVYNHVKPAANAANGKGARTPLNVAISMDGKKWFAVAVLEDSPISQYSYPSVIQTKDGMVHIVYTWRRQRIKHVVLDPTKIDLKEMGKNEIVNEQWPGMKLVSSAKPSED